MKPNTIEEIFEQCQSNKVLIHIQQGANAFNEICENGGVEALEEIAHVYEAEGYDGYWAEVSLNTDCAGQAYRGKLTDAIREAFQAMVDYAVYLKYLDPETLALSPDNPKSYIDMRHFDFKTNDVVWGEEDV